MFRSTGFTQCLVDLYFFSRGLVIPSHNMRWPTFISVSSLVRPQNMFELEVGWLAIDLYLSYRILSIFGR